jgi:hypothetical protein
MKIKSLMLFLTAVLGLCTAPLRAQIDAGRVTGTVTDQSGAVVNGAKVTLTNNDTGVASTKITADGIYTFPAVLPGTYTVRVESTGFSTHVTENVVVHVQQVATVDAQLTPGKVTEQVVVNTTTPLLQAETAEVGQTISSITVDDMPLNGRQWSSLGLLTTGTTTAPPGYNNEGANGTPSSTYYSVNGQALGNNDFRLNGVGDMLEFYSGAPAIQPPPDAIAEFKIETGDYSAELGHSLSGVINAVVKSGTNSLHGDLFDYFRNDALDAEDYFTAQQKAPKAELRQNQFGGTVGGPIYIPHVYDGRNKSFFFFDYQELRSIVPNAGGPYFTVVPSNLMQSSNFTNLQDLITYGSGTNTDGLGRMFPTGTVLDPATTRQVAAGAVDAISGLTNTSGGPIYVRDPFFNGNSVAGITDFTTAGNKANLNLLPANRLDQNALALLKLFPAPTNPNAYYAGNYFKNFDTTSKNRQYDIRIDHNFSDKDILSGFYSWSKTDAFTPPFLPGALDGGYYYNGDVTNPHRSVNGSYTHVFSPTLTNEFRLGYGKQDRYIQAPEANTLGIPAQYGIQGVPQFAGNGGLPTLSIGSLPTLGPSAYTPTIIHAHNLQIIDNVTKTFGKHVLKAGVDINDIEGDILQPPWGRGYLGFDGPYTDVNNENNGTTGIAQFLLTPIASTVPGGVNFLGGPDNVTDSSASYTNDHRWYIAGYVADSIKVTPTLTLDLGVRYDLFTPYEDIHGHQANFVPNNGDGPGGVYYIPQTQCGYPSNPAFEQLLATDGIKTVCSPGLNTGTYSKTNFAPRIGFAKRVTPKYVLRAGYGITYSPLDSIGYGPNIGLNYPFYFLVGYGAQTSSTPLRFPDPNTGTLATLETGFTPINPLAINPEGLQLLGRDPYDQATPYTQTYNLANQYEITHNDSVQVSYVGSVSRHLTNLISTNEPTVMIAPGYSTRPFLPFPDFAGNSSAHDTNGAAEYNSARVEYEHRFSSGLTALANYTFARCLTDNNPQEGFAAGGRAIYLPGFGQRADLANCGEGVAHSVHISGTYKLPFGPKMHWQGNAATNAVLGGWQINWIYTYQSGNFFGVGCTIGTTSDYGCNSDLVGNPYAGAKTITHWLNASAFANPTPPSAAQYDPVTGVLLDQTNFSFLGTTRSNAFTGPSFYNIDFSIFKEFHVNEATYFQLRAESFNVLNHPQFDNPGNLNFTNSANFGQITGVRNGGRILQLAGKFYF